jgi:cell division protein FtsQ
LTSTDNELIRRRRRKRMIKHTIILSVLLISLLIILCLKLSYFNVSNIKVMNNSIVSSDEIIDFAKVNKGTNIFYINIKNIKTNVLKNPYILKADIKRKLPNTISIVVNEREAVFYGMTDNKYLIIDKSGVVLEEKDDISNMKLTKLEGFDFQQTRLGEIIDSNNARKIENIGIITELIALNSSDIQISSVDLAEELNVKVYCGNICVKLGSNSLRDKLNLALNIIQNNNLKDKKGYVDVSFDGNPVVFIES